MKNINKYFVITITALFLLGTAFSAGAYTYDSGVSAYDSGSSSYSYTYDSGVPAYSYTYDSGIPAYSYTYDSGVPAYSYTYDSGVPAYSYTYDSGVPAYSYTYDSGVPAYSYASTYTPIAPTYTLASYCTSGSCGCNSCGCGGSVCGQSLIASCTSAPNPIQTNQSTTFYGSATGGSGSYTYSWSGNCSSSSQNCSTSFANNGTYSATFTVNSNGQTSSANCSVSVQGGNTNLSITKLVKNITQGTGYQSSVSANQNDRVGFSIQVTNTGNSTANNVWITDVLPSQLTYAGNTLVSGSYNNGSITSGINVGSLSNGQSITVTFEAQVANIYNNNNYGYSNTITNTATARADNVNSIQSTATVLVSGSTYTNLAINKLVRDNTTNNTGFQNSISANSNDSITYSIQVTNNGSNYASNVMVRDIMPSGINYVGNLRLDGNYLGGDLTSGINIGSLSNGQSRTITFDAAVVSYSGTYMYYGYSNNLTNTATAWADNISQVQDTAFVNINGTTQNGNFTMSKLTRNLSNGTGWQKTVAAAPGDIVSFSIQVTANSNNTASNVYVKDTLPAKMIFYGNLQVNGIAVSGDINSGINIGTLYNGQSSTVTFDARVLSADQFGYGNTSLINTAIAYNTSYSLTDSATVNVNRAGVLGAVTEICTGANPIFIILMIALFLALMFYFALPYLEKSNNPTVRKIVGTYYKAKAFATR